MTLDLHKLTDRVEAMGKDVAHRAREQSRLIQLVRNDSLNMHSKASSNRRARLRAHR